MTINTEMNTWNNMKAEMANWEDGPWKTEPDKAHWIDEETGLDCLIVRNHMGALCGYVGLPSEHDLYGKHYRAVHELHNDIDVHGDLTFSDGCQPNKSESTGICHSGNVAHNNVWWLGFDTAHAYDFCPSMTESRAFASVRDAFSDMKYRDFEYVQLEVKKLAKQLQLKH